ncbi:aspartate aminotransferase family protein [Cohnella sp. GCM10020058]|uniref:aspartate aminotransferase family protein n=1 Tax=Cohnella sp. GCM10020058 TaxID=3317330 RepID=UPI003625622D
MQTNTYAMDQSYALYEQSKETLCGGVASNLRSAMKPVPLFLESGSGARVFDVDGNEYIDYILGYGPLILGHSHSELLEALSHRLASGQQFGMQHRGEIELSRRLVQLVPNADKVAFSGSGTEAVMLAIRLARAYTGRSKVIRFEGHYHGWSDVIFTAFPMNAGAPASDMTALAGTNGQSAHALEDIIVVPWNDKDRLEAVLKKCGNEIAAIISEPVLCNSGCLHPLPGYLEWIRERTRDLGIVFILDEVITGFRVSPGGAQERLGIQADLVTMGKAIAGGFPLSAVAGRREIMDLISQGVVNHMGTLNGNVLSISAGILTLDILNRDEGAAYRHMEKMTERLVRGLKALLAGHGVAHTINSFGPVFHVMFTDQPEVRHFSEFLKRDAAGYSRFVEEALRQGVVLRPSGLWYVSAAHTEQDIDETLERLKKALLRLFPHRTS